MLLHGNAYSAFGIGSVLIGIVKSRSNAEAIRFALNRRHRQWRSDCRNSGYLPQIQIEIGIGIGIEIEIGIGIETKTNSTPRITRN